MNKFLLFMACTFIVITTGYSSEAHVTNILIPSGCFKDQNYCSRSNIRRDAQNIRFIDLKFYGQLANEFDTNEEIIERFTDFRSWDEYTEGSEDIQFYSTGLLYSRIHANKRELSQYARYVIKLPWPASQIEVVERITYRELDPAGIVDIYWKFFSDREFSHQGIKRKDGTLKVRFIAPLNVYFVELAMELVPTSAFLAAARKPVTKAITEVFLGMFNLN
jgi:hypothetical protein